MFRRDFFQSVFTLLAGGVLAILGLVPSVAHLLGSALHQRRTEKEWKKLGPVEDFSKETPTQRIIAIDFQDGWEVRTQNQTVFVIFEDGQPVVLSSICPHLNCPVPYDSETHRFRCPCHQSVFDQQGKLLSGVSPRDMDHLPSKTEDGNLFCQWVNYRSGGREPVEV